MTKFFRRIRQKMLTENKFSKYIIYAFGEIILLVIGILLAININERLANKKDNDLRCEYLNELKFVFAYDIKDVEENIEGFELWNPKLVRLLEAHQENSLMKLDSIEDKISTANKFIFFGQGSKSKIEELKYSNINLIVDRSLKNKILLYQDSDIMFLRNIERRSDLLEEDLRKYYSKTINLGEIELEELKDDKQFFALVLQKYYMNKAMLNLYKKLLKEQYAIKNLIESVLEKDCES